LTHWTIRREVRSAEIHYTVAWSPWGDMDRWVINRLVPSEAGLFQLWVSEGRGMVLLETEPTYYGGLRNSLREIIDELAPAGERLRKRIDGRECRFRFSVTPFRTYLEDLKQWFGGPGEAWDDDDREILVNEIESMKLFPPSPPDVAVKVRERLKDVDFVPPLPRKPG